VLKLKTITNDNNDEVIPLLKLVYRYLSKKQLIIIIVFAIKWELILKHFPRSIAFTNDIFKFMEGNII